MTTRTLLIAGLVGAAATSGVAAAVGDVDRQAWGGAEIDGRTVRVQYVGSGCEDGRWARATESGDAVTVTVWTVSRARSCSDVGVPRQAVVTLDAPVGDRRVADGSR